MELILLRHGKAEDFHAGGDYARELVEKGHAQATQAARFLSALDGLPDVVLSSPRVRARQTAESFCRHGGMAGPVMQSWLDCGMTPEDAFEELRAFSDFESVMIVGHEPDFSGLVEWLLGCRSGRVEVKKAALVGLRCSPPSRRAELRFLVPPKMIGVLEKS